MKTILNSLIVTVVLFLSSNAYSQCPGGVCAPNPEPKVDKEKDVKKEAEINTGALKALIDAKAVFVLLDARSGKWDDGQRIPGAKSLNDKSSKEDIAKVIKTKDTLVVTYCSNLKCPASKRLAKHLRSLGYTNVLEYPHGIDGWRKAGFKTEKAK